MNIYRFGCRISVISSLVVLLGLVVVPTVAGAQTVVSVEKPLSNSVLTGPLFQQLLIAEIELNAGNFPTAYQLTIEAAKQTKEAQLFRRATEIALQARAGDDALNTVKAWRKANAESADALRYEIQLLVQLNRTTEAVEPMQTLLKICSTAQRPSVIFDLPRLLARNKNYTQTASLIEQVLAPYLNEPSTRSAAQVTLGRAWLIVPDNTKALFWAKSAHELDRANEAAAGLAVDLMSSTPSAEGIIQSHLSAKSDSHSLRLAYVRALLNAQRLSDATTEIDILTQQAPKLPQAWLTLGALHLQQREPALASSALHKYIDLIQTSDQTESTNQLRLNLNDDTTANTKDEALARGWLLLSQAADQEGDFKGADAWLAKVDVPERLLEVLLRRASLMARGGSLPQARELIQRMPEKSSADARAKALAEAQILRDVKQWAEANTLLTKANLQFPDDVDLLYEQSMMLEKLNRLTDMERLLRRVIELKPDHQHAYNALGFSLAERNLRLPEARNLIKKALELSPGESSITDSLGWVEYKLGNHPEALRLLREAYRGQPDAEIGAHLGEVLWTAGEKEEAKRIWREARKRDVSNDVLHETLVRLRVSL
jgi:tetratricopeptide (TPR) repeat protein